MTQIRFSDISQWQPSFDAEAYLRAGHKVIIVRAYSKDDGPDAEMPQRRDYVRQHDFTAVGYYQRLNADRDAAGQARDFIKTVGSLKPNEFPVLDLEDGSGNQSPRAEAWFDVVDPWAGFPSSLYSGEYFFRDCLGGPGRWGARPCWIANYTDSGQPDEPAPDGSDWWQFSCTYSFPGLPGKVDANLFAGSAQDFLARVRPGAQPSAAGAYSGREGQPVVSNPDGRLEVFARAGADVAHRWQLKAGGEWNKQWAALGQPGQGAAMISVVSNKDGRLEVFAVDDQNRVSHRWQTEPGGPWNEKWSGIGQPGDVTEKGSTISAILRKDGCVAIFVQTVKGGVWRRWQASPGGKLNEGWSNMGQP